MRGCHSKRKSGVAAQGNADGRGWFPTDALSAGQSTEGNQFVYSDDLWRYNFSAKGTYGARLVASDESLYIVDPPRSGDFVAK